MNKEKFLKLLVDQLKRLEEVEHISELAENGQYEKVDAIIAETDYTSLQQYYESANFKSVDITEIPKEYVLTFAIYLSGSKYDEMDIVSTWEEFQASIEYHGNIGLRIAEHMDNNPINSCRSFAGRTSFIFN